MYNREVMFQSLMVELLIAYNKAVEGTNFFYVLRGSELVLKERVKHV